jgi:hypothetical protein
MTMHRRPPPLVGPRRDLVLCAFVAVAVLVGLAAAALLATLGDVEGASVTPSPSQSEDPPVGREDAAQATTGRGSVSTPAEEAPEPETVPTGTVEPQDVDQVPAATDDGSPTAVERSAASSAQELRAGTSSAGAPVSGSSSPAGVQDSAPAAPSPPSAGPAPSGSGSVIPAPPSSSTAAPVPPPVPDRITPAPAPTPTPRPVPTTAPVKPAPEPARDPVPPATAADPEPSEQAGAHHRTAEEDRTAEDDGQPKTTATPVPDLKPTSTPPVTEPTDPRAG